MLKKALQNKAVLKLAFRSYVSECSMGNLKKSIHNGLLTLAALFLIYPFILFKISEESMMLVIRYWVYVLSAFAAIVLMSMHYIRLPKQMYLCPISRQEREEYLLDHYVINLVIPLGMLAMVQFVAMMCAVINPMQYGISLVMDLLLCLGMSFHIGEYSEGTIWFLDPTPLDKLKADEKIAQGIALFEFICFPVGIFEDMSNRGTLVFVALAIVFQLLGLGKLMKNFGMIMEYNMDYENLVKIMTKQKKKTV